MSDGFARAQWAYDNAAPPDESEPVCECRHPFESHPENPEEPPVCLDCDDCDGFRELDPAERDDDLRWDAADRAYDDYRSGGF